MQCVAPNRSTTGSFPFRLSLNAQQYTPNLTFAFYASPTILASEVSPSSGPSAGQTRVVVSSSSLAGGSEYNCSFGEVGYVPAVHEAASGHVVCFSPPAESVYGEQFFSVALNGQQVATRTPTNRPTHLYLPCTTHTTPPTTPPPTTPPPNPHLHLTHPPHPPTSPAEHSWNH